MTSVHIRRRTLANSCPVCKTRVHYLVLYRLGGRGFPELAAGTFHRLKDAETRRDVVAGEIAAMRDPRKLLDEIREPRHASRTYRQWAAAYQASRIDHSEKRQRNVQTAIRQLLPIFGELDPHKQTVPDQIEAVAQLSKGRKPSTVREYWTIHRLILDFAGVLPNPSRDKAVKLPQRIHVEVQPPTAEHVLAILDHAPKTRRLPLVVIEQTGMAAGEIGKLEWGDVDEQGCRFRLRRATVKAQIQSRARWVQVPAWLMALVAATCPQEDRTADRRVFSGQTPDGLGSAMWRACRDAGIPSYSPHDLRHRRLSLWHGQGVPVKELAARAGHSQASMTLNVYAHVLLEPTEIEPEQFVEALK